METKESSAWNTSMKWAEMRGEQKAAFIFKNILNLAAFGFLFPHLWD